MDDRVFAKIAYVERGQSTGSCQDELGRHVALHVASFPTADIRFKCRTHSGRYAIRRSWLEDRRECQEEIDSRGHRYRLLRVDRDGQQMLVAFWYQLGADVVTRHEDLRKIMQKLRHEGKAWPPIVKVLMQVPLEFDADAARESCENLSAPIYEWILTNS